MGRDNFNDHEANKVWQKQFGNANSGKDITGTIVQRHDHGENGWHVDHIKPVSKGGSNNINNLQVLNSKDNMAKANNYPCWIDMRGKEHCQ